MRARIPSREQTAAKRQPKSDSPPQVKLTHLTIPPWDVQGAVQLVKPVVADSRAVPLTPKVPEVLVF